MAVYYCVLVFAFFQARVEAECSLISFDFRAEGKAASLGAHVYVDNQLPILSWKLAVSGPALPARQTAYRVVASTTASNLMEGMYDAWDSGLRNGSDSTDIAYGGSGLTHPGDTIVWSVFLVDGSNALCPLPSSPYPAVTLSIVEEAWRPAVWVSATNIIPADDDPCSCYLEQPVPLFRKEFMLKPAIVAAHLFITGLGFYKGTLNGIPISTAILDPAWTSVRKRTLYSAWNVTHLVRENEANVLGVAVGRGWYDPLPMLLFGAFNLRNALAIGPPRVIAYLLIMYTDGSREVIGTDPTWRVGEGSVRRNNVYIGVQEDLRVSRNLVGWDSPGFDASSWPLAVECTHDNIGALQLQTAPHIRVTANYAPTRIEPVSGKNGSFTVSFPVNMAGVVSLKGVTADRGTVTTLTFAEILDPSTGLINPITNLAGSIGRWNSSFGLCAPVPAYESDNVTWAGTGEESFAPTFTWHAFQHMQIDGWPAAHGPPVIDNFLAQAFNTDNDASGNTFTSWNPQHGAIDALARQSFLSNWAGGIQSDCPGRERLGYGGDMLVASDAAMLQFDLRNFYAKRINDYADAAQENGGLPETAPFMGIESCDTIGNGTGPMQWGAAHSTLLLAHWERYGSLRLLQENWATQVAWLALLNSSTLLNASTDLPLLTSGLPDFTQSSASCNDTCTCPLMTMFGTAYLHQQAANGVRLANVLNKTTEADAFLGLAAIAKASFLASFFNPTTGMVGSGGIEEQLWALDLGIVDEADNPAAFQLAVNVVLDAIRANGTHMFLGAFGSAFFLRDGPAWGLGDVILETLSQVDYPSYGFMLSNNATALFEHWDAVTALTSFNHAWLGSISAYLRRYLGGISHDDTAIGFDHVVIRPYPPSYNSTAAQGQVPGLPIPSRGGPPPSSVDLPWANTSYNSIRGIVNVSWWYSETTGSESVAMHMDVSLPPNIRCTVFRATRTKSQCVCSSGPCGRKKCECRGKCGAGVGSV